MHGTPIVKYNVTNSVIDIKAAPCTIIGGTITSTSTTDGFLVFFNKPAAQVTLGTTQPDYFVSCYGLSGAPLVRAGEGVDFSNAVSVAFVDAIPLGSAARVANLSLVIQ